MKNFKRQLKRLLVMFLVVSMIVCELPVNFVLAANQETTITDTVSGVEEVNSSDETVTEELETEEVEGTTEAVVLSEIEELRDEQTKYFEMSDGTVKACIYPQAVHYLENGEYKEIDNTLELIEIDNSVQEDVIVEETEDPQIVETEVPNIEFEEVTEEPLSESVEDIAETSETITDTVGSHTITDMVGSTMSETITDTVDVASEASELISNSEEVSEAASASDEQVEESSASTEESVFSTTDNEQTSDEEQTEEPVAESIVEETAEPQMNAEKVESSEEVGAYYENKANSFKVRLPANYESGYTEFIDENGFVRFKLLGTEKKKLEKQKSKEIKDKDETIVKKVNSHAIYKSLHKDVDVEYDVVGDRLKETIVLNRKTKQDFVFAVETSANKAVLNEDGSISFYAIDGTELYVMAAPYMVDESGAYSDAVEVKLLQTDKGYTLTYRPDEEWLYDKEREYPVRIDPTMFKAVFADKDQVSDTYIWNTQTNVSENLRGDKDVINIGKRYSTTDGLQQVLRGLIKFNLPSELSDNDTIVDAKLYLTHYLDPRCVSVDGIQIDLHELEEDFVENTAWWAGSDKVGETYAFSDQVIDYAIVDTKQYYPDTEVSYDVFNFTELANKWHSGEKNNGILLKLHNESITINSTSNNKQVYYFSKNSEYFSSVSKFVEITYRNMLGIEDYWAYSSHGIGRTGVGSVNLYNGNLVYTNTEITSNTEVNSFSIGHVFNNGAEAEANLRCGDGWRLNLFQRVFSVSVPGNSAVKYVYIDADGTKHYLVETDGKIVDEDGLGYTYSATGNANLPHKLTSKDKTEMVFDGLGFLRSITDANGNKITLNVSKIINGHNYVHEVVTSTGDCVTLQYDSDNDYRLSSITDKAGRVTEYSYTGNKLTTISYPDGTETTFAYDGDRLYTVCESDGSGCKYYYNAAGEVVSIEYLGKNGVNGNTDTFTYSYCETTVTDSIGYSTTYQFDTSGRVTCIYDSEGNICGCQ